MANNREAEVGGGMFFLGLLLGAAVGAALGLLYAPRAGEEMRRDLAQRSEELYEQARKAREEHESGEAEGEDDGDSDEATEQVPL